MSSQRLMYIKKKSKLINSNEGGLTMLEKYIAYNLWPSIFINYGGEREKEKESLTAKIKNIVKKIKHIV